MFLNTECRDVVTDICSVNSLNISCESGLAGFLSQFPRQAERETHPVGLIMLV